MTGRSIVSIKKAPIALSSPIRCLERFFNFQASPNALKRNLHAFFLHLQGKGEGSLKLSGSLRRGWRGESLWRRKLSLRFKLLRKVHNNLALSMGRKLLRISCQVVMNLAQQLVHEVQHVSPDTPPPPTPQASQKLEASLPLFPPVRGSKRGCSF